MSRLTIIKEFEQLVQMSKTLSPAISNGKAVQKLVHSPHGGNESTDNALFVLHFKPKREEINLDLRSFPVQKA